MAAVDEATALQDKAPQTTPSDFGHVLRNGIVLNRKSDCTIETGVKRLSRMMQRMLRGELVSSKDGLFLKAPSPLAALRLRGASGAPTSSIARVGAARSAGTLHGHVRRASCCCVDVRAHARGLVCGLGPGRDVAGGRPARDARASGRVRAHRSRGRAPRRTRNPAPPAALLPPLPRARLLPRALVLALCFPGVSRRPPPRIGSSNRHNHPTRRSRPLRSIHTLPLESLSLFRLALSILP